MTLLTPSVAQGANFVLGTTTLRQTDNSADPFTSGGSFIFNALQGSGTEMNELKSLLALLLNVAANSVAVAIENTTGSDIPAASLCYITNYDATNNAFIVALATSTNPPTLVTLSDLPNAGFGVGFKATASAANLNTSAASAVGALVYQDLTTPGGWVFATGGPVVGMVTVKDAAVGQISFSISGSGAPVTYPLSIANGGSGQATQQLALNAIAGAVTTAKVLAGDGTNVTLRSLLTADMPVFQNVVEQVQVLGNVAGPTQAIALGSGNIVSATSTGNTAWSVTGAPASGKASYLQIWLRNGGAHAQTGIFASADWGADGAPSLTASGMDIITFETIDGGSTWRGTYKLGYA